MDVSEVLINRTLGSPFGTLDAGPPFAGLGAMFDGVQINNNPNFGAYKNATSAYVGKTFPSPKLFSRAVFYGWTDRGIIDGGGTGTATVYGKNGAIPAHGTDGTVLGSASFVEPTSLPHGSGLEIASNGASGTFTHIWVNIVSTSTPGICGAELVLYESVESGAPLPSSRPLAILLGAGQSNMVGGAPIPEQSVYANRARISSFALDGQIKMAADPLMEPTGSLWSQFNSVSPGCGSMLACANSLVATFKNFDVLICNSSKGSTSIEQWQPGGALYDGMIDRATAALQTAPDGSFLAGLVWQQGESDTDTEAGAANWMVKVGQLIANVRADLGQPDIPVVIVGLGPYDAFAPGWGKLRFAQTFMKLPHCTTFVKTSDLSNINSADWGITASVLAIGSRVADAMRPLLPSIL